MTDEEDPKGQRTPAAADLRRGGIPPVETAKDPSAAGRRLLLRLRADWFPLLTALVLSVVSVSLLVYGPKLLGRATDVVARGVRPGGGGLDSTALRNALLAATGVYAGGAAAAWLQGRLMAAVIQRAMSQLRTDAGDKIYRLPMAYLDRTPRGDLLSRVTNDIDNLGQSLQFSAGQAVTAVFTVLGVATMMFTISPLLACLVVAVAPVAALSVRRVGRLGKQRFVRQWSHTGRLNSHVEETFAGHAIVTAFGRQHEVEAAFAEINRDVYVSSFRAQLVAGVMQPVMLLLGNLNYLVVAVVGALRVSSGAVTIGEVQAFLQYSRQFTNPLAQLAGMMNLFQSGLASAERIFELLDAPEETIDPPLATALPAPRGRVEFSRVRFSYLPDRPLIEDLSLVAEAGETVAIVGPTGAGKTTLVNLIMRFYDIDAGAITVDGVDISSLTRAELRSHIGIVLQETWLFDGTIRENIRYGDPSATDAQVLEAARAAYVDRFVQALPDGYDTRIGDDGGSLSTGEKQLITIARALLAQPKILILDEATSSVDTRTELLVQHAMEVLRAERTSFVIAHRLSTIRDAHHILMMDSGRIVEQGTHDQLLARGGAYAALYQAQFSAPAVDEADLDQPLATPLPEPVGVDGGLTS
jgi:ATP-binding cassette subfamily B multidrug efflux pump